MGRKSIIPVLEAKHGKPINEIITELASKGDLKSITNSLGIQKSLAYDLLKEAGIKPKNLGKNHAETLGEGEMVSLVNSFLMAKQVSGRTRQTIITYRGNLERFLWYLKDKGLPLELAYCFTPERLREFLYYVQTTPIRFGGTNITSRRLPGAATIGSYWRTFQTFGAWLVMEGKLEDSPFFRNATGGRKIEKPKQPKLMVPEIPTEIVREIIANCNGTFNGKRDKAIIILLFDTGIRLAELCQLKVSDLNLEIGLVKVFGKGQKERLVRLGQVSREALADYMEFRKDMPLPELWLRMNGEILARDGIRALFAKIDRKYPDIKITPHVFRHTFASNYIRGEGDVFTLQMLGGWSSLEMPRHYAAALTQEDAFKAHEKASPADNLLGGK